MKKEDILKNIEEAGVDTTGMDALKADTLLSIHNALAQRDEAIDALNAQLQVAEKAPAAAKHIVKLGEDEYELIVPRSSLNGQIITAETLKSNSDELKALVAMQSGVIQKI